MKLIHLVLFLLLLPFSVSARDIEQRVENGYADSNGVKIHYVTLGQKKNPPILFIHGFPDFWYSWRDIMGNLSRDHYTIAVDQRGYNLSDKPKGEENYQLQFLVDDIAAVMRKLKLEKAVIVGHDWGGVVAWEVAMQKPELVERLVILNLPHLRGLKRELANNPEQQKSSAYGRFFQTDGAYKNLTVQQLVDSVAPNKQDTEIRKKYAEAFNRSDIEAMINYYRQNYPREPYAADTSPVIKVKAPVLMIHGLTDKFLLAGALNNTWDWLENDLTLVTLPKAGHFVQHDQPDMVIRSIRMWLGR